MRIKVISEGYGHNTKVVDERTGEEIEGVRSIEWRASPGELNSCTIEFHSVPLEVVAEEIKRYELSNENS